MHDKVNEMASCMQQGMISVPSALLKHYQTLGLNEAETMLILHLLDFRMTEQKTFPSIDELQARMSIPSAQTVTCLEKLIARRCLVIEEYVDRQTGIRSERYNLTPLYERLAECLIRKSSDASKETAAAREGENIRGEVQDDVSPSTANDDIFTVFEKEFARPLTPMECEMISAWIDQDRHSQELIKAALKEAVFAGKVYFRYIDRILLEWGRNRVRTPEDAREYARQFRG